MYFFYRKINQLYTRFYEQKNVSRSYAIEIYRLFEINMTRESGDRRGASR